MCTFNINHTTVTADIEKSSTPDVNARSKWMHLLYVIVSIVTAHPHGFEWWILHIIQ